MTYTLYRYTLQSSSSTVHKVHSHYHLGPTLNRRRHIITTAPDAWTIKSRCFHQVNSLDTLSTPDKKHRGFGIKWPFP